MQHLEAVGWPPNHIALALTPGIDVRGEDTDRASDLSMGAEEEVDSSALCPMDPGDRDFIAVLVEPCTRFRMVQVNVDHAEPLCNGAHERIGPALPPSANNCFVCARVLESAVGQRRLVLLGVVGDVLARERRNALAGETASMIERPHGAVPGGYELRPVAKFGAPLLRRRYREPGSQPTCRLQLAHVSEPKCGPRLLPTTASKDPHRGHPRFSEMTAPTMVGAEDGKRKRSSC